MVMENDEKSMIQVTNRNSQGHVFDHMALRLRKLLKVAC